MIEREELANNDLIGHKVLYNAHHSIEEGVIISFNSEYVFVRFGADQGSKACRRQDLELIHAYNQ